jgi:flagellar FliJ protein
MAKRFVFKLETVLRLRQQREDRQKRVVAERLRQIGQMRGRIAALERQIREQVAGLRADALHTTLDVVGLARNRHYLSRLQRHRLEAQSQLGMLEKRLAQERAVLAHAAKERKVIEKLKERQYARYQKDLARQERIEADDLSTTRYAFRRAEALAV